MMKNACRSAVNFYRFTTNFLRFSLCLTLLFTLQSYSWAKAVSVNWDKVDGAEKYELLIEKDGKAAVKIVIPQAQWSGDLPFGAYVYQIRGIDPKGRAGEWSQLNMLVVMATAPVLASPAHKTPLTLVQNQPVHLQWEPIDGAREYLVEIAKKKEIILSTTVSTAEFRTAQLPEGIYNWRVTGILSAGPSYPAFSEQSWKTSPSAPRIFQLKYKNFQKVKLTFPLGDQWPSESGEMRFSWESVPGAEAYEVRINKKFAAGASTADKKKEKILISETTSIMANVGKEGVYSWSVRPLTDVQVQRSEDFIAGQASYGEFRLLRDFLTEGNTWLLDLSAFYNTGLYEFTDNNKNLAGSFDSQSLSTRVSGEYWLAPNWAVGGGIEGTFFKVNNEAYRRFAFNGQVKRRMEMGLGWYFGTSLGLEFRQYPEVSFKNSVSKIKMLSSYGPSLSLDLSKQFTERWSLRAIGHFYYPFMYINDMKNQGTESRNNFSLGAQVLYWMNKSFGLAAGAFVEQRGLGYNKKDNFKTLRLDGEYLFGSAILRFD